MLPAEEGILMVLTIFLRSVAALQTGDVLAPVGCDSIILIAQSALCLSRVSVARAHHAQSSNIIHSSTEHPTWCFRVLLYGAGATVELH